MMTQAEWEAHRGADVCRMQLCFFFLFFFFFCSSVSNLLFSPLGLISLFSKNVDSEKHPGRVKLENQTQEQVVKHTREVL